MPDLHGPPRHRVSRRGQLLLPAGVRERWGLHEGGEVEVFDLGDAVVILPGQPGAAQHALAAALTTAHQASIIAAIDDPDLVDS